MINPYLAGGMLLLGLLGGWTVRDWKADSDAVKALERAREAERKALAAVGQPSERFEELMANLRQSEIITRNTIREIYRDVEVPANCAVPAAGVGLLEASRARANAAATGQPSSTLPGFAGDTQAADRPGQAPVGE